MSAIPVYQYTPLPALEVKITIPFDDYEAYIKKEPEVRGVTWVYKSYSCASGLPIEYIDKSESWSKYYQCHRARAPRKRTRDEMGNSTKKRPAKFQVSFGPADPSNVSIKYPCQHNHVIGSFEDMKHLTLSSALKELTESQLSLGYDKRDVRVSLQKHFSQSATSTHPDHFVHADKIYNIYRKIQQQ
ncbi:hypothetical protein BDF21DRAFT_497987 [Thamnidium elegans]|nr:hypothetical protein BDF21DRAFT_497987 [Thamnidium elegans]